MKNIKSIKILSVIIGLFIIVIGCKDDYDDITSLTPGADATVPVIKMTYPVEGTKIKVLEPVISINSIFEVSDDIEIKEVKVNLDNKDITTISQFKDYRRFVGEIKIDGIATGLHKITISATDNSGKTTTQVVNFEKEAPYTPLFAGETMYVPFDNDYIDLINLRSGTKIGSPTFANESIIKGSGVNAYKGAKDAYVTFPTTTLKTPEFSATFWMKVNASPDRAGILVMGPPDPNSTAFQNNRNSGFRFFRENAGGKQRFKLNVGNGTADTWVDGGAAADVDPTVNAWNHFAITISRTEASVYINGKVARTSTVAGGVNWDGCDVLSIMSGFPRFTEWGHASDESIMDELRLYNRALSANDIANVIKTESGAVVGYVAKYDGEKMYMSFDESFKDLLTNTEAAKVGSPTLTNTDAFKAEKSYQGATGGYLSFATNDLKSPSFSASMWMRVNATPDRAGILVMGPPDTANPTAPNNRKNGFRFFRENAGGKQRFKLNVGNGTADNWIDGGAAADVDPTQNTWVHLAFTISPDSSAVFINGNVATKVKAGPVNWDGCDILSIMSGVPRFTEWGHMSDLSKLDELRVFNKELSRAEVRKIFQDGNK